jgi:hypothetical protein
MHSSTKLLGKSSLAAILAGGLIVVTASVASADVACNSYGECWQTRERYELKVYPPELGIQFYDDDWRKAHEHDEHFHWMKDRDDDHGYYSHGEWHVFVK